MQKFIVFVALKAEFSDLEIAKFLKVTRLFFNNVQKKLEAFDEDTSPAAGEETIPSILTPLKHLNSYKRFRT